MDDRETVVRSPHDATVSRTGGRRHVQVDDPRTSVSIQEEAATLTLFFDPEKAWTGDAQLLEVRLSPTAGGEFRPWVLLSRLPRHLQYARATLANKRGDITAALQALREHGKTRRGLSDDFLREIAQLYERLVAEGEPYPAKVLAEHQHAHKSTVSRWISAARQRGLLAPKESE